MQICSKYDSCALSLCSFIHWRWYYPNHLNYISAWNTSWWPQTFHFSKSRRWYTAFIKLSQPFFFFFGLEKLLFYLHFLKDPFAGYRMLESESHSVVSDSLWPRGLYSPWNSLGQKLEWVAVLFLRGSSQPRDRTQVSHIAGRFFTSWATGETQTFHLSKLGRWYMAFNKLSQLFYLPGKVFVCLESWVDRLFLPSFFSFLPWFHCLLTRLL